MPSLGTLTIDTALNTATLQADLSRAASLTDATARRMTKSWDDFGSGMERTFRRVFEIATGVGLANIGEAFARFAVNAVQDLAKLGLETQRQEQAFARMTAALGVNGQALEAALEQASRGIADVSDVMTTAVAAMQENLQPEQLVKVMEIATAQSQLMGTTVTEAFNQITRAILAQQERGLKTAGIYVDMTSALEDHARTLGTTADRLTETAKVQAVYEAVVQKTRGTVANLNSEMLTNAQNAEKLSTAWTNVKETLGKNLVDMGAGIVTWGQAFTAQMRIVGESIDSFIAKIPLLGSSMAQARKLAAAEAGAAGEAGPGMATQLGRLPEAPAVKGPSDADIRRASDERTRLAKQAAEELRRHEEALTAEGLRGTITAIDDRIAEEERLSAMLRQIDERRHAERLAMEESHRQDMAQLARDEVARLENEARASSEVIRQDLEDLTRQVREFDEAAAAGDRRREMLGAHEQRMSMLQAEGGEWRSVTGSIRSGLMDIITTTEQWGATAERVAERVASSLLDTVINRALKPAEDALIKFIEQMARVGITNISGFFSPGATTAVTAGDYGAGLGTVGATAYASGGIVTRPTLGLVGEKGPEAIVPLDQYQGGWGGGTVVNIIDQRSPQAPQAEVRETMRDGRREIEVLITDTVDRAMAGGRFNRTLQSTYGVGRRGVRS